MSYKKNSLPPSHPLNRTQLDKDLCTEEYLQEIQAIRTAASLAGQQTLQGTISRLDRITKPQVTRQDFEQLRRHEEEERNRNHELDRLSLKQKENGDDNNGDDRNEEVFGFSGDELSFGDGDNNGESDAEVESVIRSWDTAVQAENEDTEEEDRSSRPTTHRIPTGPASAAASTSETVAQQQRRENYLEGVKDRRLATVTQNRQAIVPVPRMNYATPNHQPAITTNTNNNNNNNNNSLSVDSQTAECFFCCCYKYFIQGTLLYRYCSKLMDAVNSHLIWSHDATIYMVVDWYNSLRTWAAASGIFLPFVNHAILLNHLRNHCQLLEATKFEFCQDWKSAFKVIMRNAITIHTTKEGIISQAVNFDHLKAAIAVSNQYRAWASLDTTKVNHRTARYIQQHSSTENDLDFNPANDRNPFVGSQWHNPPFLHDIKTLVKVKNKK